MPIRPEHRWLYPIDWEQLSAWVRFERAQGRCERCGRPHKQVVFHLGDGRWWDAMAGVWRDGAGRKLRSRPAHALFYARMTHVVLATAHLDYDPTNNAPRNLSALCQRCHMLHDAVEHRRRRWWNRFRRCALGDLFDGRYGDVGGASFDRELRDTLQASVFRDHHLTGERLSVPDAPHEMVPAPSSLP